MASIAARLRPASQRDGRTTKSEDASQERHAAWLPTKRTPSGADCTVGPSGPPPTRTKVASGTLWRTRCQRSRSRSWPFCSHSRPTQTTVGTSSKPTVRRASVRVDRLELLEAYPIDYRLVASPDSVTLPKSDLVVRHSEDDVTPSHRISLPGQGQALRNAFSGQERPGVRLEDGWHVPPDSQPTSKASFGRVNAKSGATRSTSLESRLVSLTTARPGVLEAGQLTTATPAWETRRARYSSGGQATVTSHPLTVWSCASPITTFATPAVVGCDTCRTLISASSATGGLSTDRRARPGSAPGRHDCRIQSFADVAADLGWHSDQDRIGWSVLQDDRIGAHRHAVAQFDRPNHGSPGANPCIVAN